MKRTTSTYEFGSFLFHQLFLLFLVFCLAFSFKSLFIVFVFFPYHQLCLLVDINVFVSTKAKNLFLVKLGVATKRFF